MSQKKQQNKATARQKVAVSFSPNGWEDYQHWKTSDAAISARIDELIKDCLRSPFRGIGKPEGLVGDYSGFWSRRIDREHRLVYLYENDQLYIVQCRYHYDD